MYGPSGLVAVAPAARPSRRPTAIRTVTKDFETHLMLVGSLHGETADASSLRFQLTMIPQFTQRINAGARATLKKLIQDNGSVGLLMTQDDLPSHACPSVRRVFYQRNCRRHSCFAVRDVILALQLERTFSLCS
jgi:hypothetical protein